MINYILIFIISYLAVTEKQVCPIKITGFDVVKWRTDSIGCENKRFPLARILLKNKEKIIGLKRSEVRSFLGKGNEIFGNGDVECYYIEHGVQCLDIHKNSPGPLEVAKLIVDYEGDVVQDVSIAIV